MQIPKWMLVLIFIAAFIGFADASYLTAEHLRGVVPPCSTRGCDTVLTSAYASVGPIPLAAFGVAYYAALLVCLILFLDTGNNQWMRRFTWLVSVGMLMTLVLVALQLFVLHAICQYCMLSAAMTAILFGSAVALRHRFSIKTS